MVPLTPPGRRARWAMLVAVSALAAVAALGTSPSRAHAGAITTARAQAAAIERQINALYVREDAAGEAYDKALSQLADVRRSIRRNTVRLDVARSDLRVTRRRLAAMVVSAYKHPTQGSATAFLLSSASLGDLITRADELNRIQSAQRQAFDQVRSAEQRVQRRQAELRADAARTRRLVAKARRNRDAIAAIIAQQHRLLANAQANVRRLVAARNRRLAARAAARAAAARAAAAAAAKRKQAAAAPSSPAPVPVAGPAPGGGKSGGGGGGGNLPPPSPLGVRAVQIAETQLGVRYTWGGASPSTGFDCSGLVMWTYDQLGIHLDHYTGAQWVAGPHVPYDQLAPGDLVFFEPGIGHVGIYVGNGLYINAPHTGSVVMINSLSDPWAQAEYQGAVRVAG